MTKYLLYWLFYLLPGTLLAQVADSTAQEVTQEVEPAAQYVNASSLTLRASPTASGQPLATIAGASRVQVLDVKADGWSHVLIGDHTGYVKSEYLVAAQEEVAADLDWTVVEQAGGQLYAQVTVLDAPARAPRVAATTQRSGPKVYICNNGRTEVYHRSESCSAMRRCTYVTRIASTGEARGDGLRECLKCY